MSFTCYGCLSPTLTLFQIGEDLRCKECVQALYEALILEKSRGLNAVKGSIVCLIKEVHS
jgi:hypothetical protein